MKRSFFETIGSAPLHYAVIELRDIERVQNVFCLLVSKGYANVSLFSNLLEHPSVLTFFEDRPNISLQTNINPDRRYIVIELGASDSKEDLVALLLSNACSNVTFRSSLMEHPAVRDYLVSQVDDSIVSRGESSSTTNTAAVHIAGMLSLTREVGDSNLEPEFNEKLNVSIQAKDSNLCKPEEATIKREPSNLSIRRGRVEEPDKCYDVIQLDDDEEPQQDIVEPANSVTSSSLIDSTLSASASHVATTSYDPENVDLAGKPQLNLSNEREKLSKADLPSSKIDPCGRFKGPRKIPKDVLSMDEDEQALVNTPSTSCQNESSRNFEDFGDLASPEDQNLGTPVSTNFHTAADRTEEADQMREFYESTSVKCELCKKFIKHPAHTVTNQSGMFCRLMGHAKTHSSAHEYFCPVASECDYSTNNKQAAIYHMSARHSGRNLEPICTLTADKRRDWIDTFLLCYTSLEMEPDYLLHKVRLIGFKQDMKQSADDTRDSSAKPNTTPNLSYREQWNSPLKNQGKVPRKRRQNRETPISKKSRIVEESAVTSTEVDQPQDDVVSDHVRGDVYARSPTDVRIQKVAGNTADLENLSNMSKNDSETNSLSGQPINPFSFFGVQPPREEHFDEPGLRISHQSIRRCSTVIPLRRAAAAFSFIDPKPINIIKAATNGESGLVKQEKVEPGDGP